MNEHVLPLAYILLQNKSTEAYRRALESLTIINPSLELSNLIFDFEQASINSFKEMFPNVSIKGCFFHFSPANWRKIQALGLSTFYKENMKVQSKVKCCVVLALIPQQDVYEGFNSISEDNEFEELNANVEYFESTWLGSPCRLGKRTKATFDISICSQFEHARDGKQKTNNSVECWHRAFQGGMGLADRHFRSF